MIAGATGGGKFCVHHGSHTYINGQSYSIAYRIVLVDDVNQARAYKSRKIFVPKMVSLGNTTLKSVRDITSLL
jgi:hypothetical protein